MAQAVTRAVGSNAGERQVKLCSPARPPLASRRAARFLTGRGPVLVRSTGVGDP